MKPNVFIGSSTEGLHVADAVQQALSHHCNPIIWNEEVFKEIFVPIESLFDALEKFDFAVFVLLPEDSLIIRNDEKFAVRDNILFEMGLFMGKLGRTRVFFIAPRGHQVNDLHLPSDLSGITPASYDADAGNLVTAVNTALYQLKRAIKKVDDEVQITTTEDPNAILYDGSKEMSELDFQCRNSFVYKGRDPASPRSEGNVQFLPDGAIHLQRLNSDGRYEIELRARGPGAPTLPRKVNPPYRNLVVTCEARVVGADHDIRFVWKDIEADKWVWDKLVKVSGPRWASLEFKARVPAIVDLLFRIDDLNPSQPTSSLYLRGLRIVEKA